jgi:glyoxylase-like metal-dependent hydrolase (beta-lactamase superfamily II)
MPRTSIALLIAGICASPALVSAQDSYPPVPSIPAIGVRNTSYAEIPAGSEGPAVDPSKGYRLQELGDGLYLITDNQIQSLFLVYDRGVVVIDVPTNYATKLPQAIAEVTKNPITHVIYSHSHIDHIGGTKSLGGHPMIIAHQETLKLLKRAADPNRPLPTVTFADRYTLHAGKQVLELSYHGDGHEPGNIFIYAPAQKVLMAVDLVFPGWMMWRRFAVAHDVPGVFAQVEEIRKMDWQTVVGGHVTRTGTRADVEVQAEFMRDLKQAAAAALAATKPGEGMDPHDTANPWALFDNYIDRVATKCVNAVTPKWGTRLAGFDVYIWDQCYAMEQSLRID